jgi:phosphinothricin acetyltransferase
VSDVDVRAMTAADWPAVERIYAEGIATRNATFAAAPPTWAEFDAGHTAEHRLVAVAATADAVGRSQVVGWAACSRTSSRCVYAGVLEISVYVASAARGTGVGSALMAELVAQSEAAGIWTLQSGIFPENAGSLALHHRFGFRDVGRRERVGQMDGVWRDVLLVERRSAVVG